MSEGINDAAYTPAVFFSDGKNLRGSGSQCASEDRIGIGHRQDNANGAAVQALRTEVSVFGRLVPHPKLCAFDRKPRDDAAPFVHAKNFHGSKCGLVELDGLSAVPNGEPGRDRSANRSRVDRHKLSNLTKEVMLCVESTPENFGQTSLGLSLSRIHITQLPEIPEILVKVAHFGVMIRFSNSGLFVGDGSDEGYPLYAKGFFRRPGGKPPGIGISEELLRPRRSTGRSKWDIARW